MNVVVQEAPKVGLYVTLRRLAVQVPSSPTVGEYVALRCPGPTKRHRVTFSNGDATCLFKLADHLGTSAALHVNTRARHRDLVFHGVVEVFAT